MDGDRGGEGERMVKQDISEGSMGVGEGFGTLVRCAGVLALRFSAIELPPWYVYVSFPGTWTYNLRSSASESWCLFVFGLSLR